MRKRRWLRRERRTDIPDPEARIDQVLTSYQAEIADRLETGLREIQSRTASLIHDIATEVWRSGDKDADLQERVISVLSRDAAIRGLLSHSDERYQALDIRMNRVQERLQSVTDVMEEVRRTVETAPVG